MVKEVRHMRGIILAAGRGSRLNGHVHDGPKALLRVGNKSLIERQIVLLRQAGICDIAVVVGCEADAVRKHCGSGITYVENTEYATTNSLYSLWMARALLLGGGVVLNCDVLFHPQLLHDLLTARHEAALMLAYRKPDDPPFGDEEMKVKVRGGRVVDMSKAMSADDADGENVGMLRFDAEVVPTLIEKLESLVAAGGRRDWAPRAFTAFAAERPLYAVGTRGYPWTEIDFPEDYERALRDVLPEIEGVPASGAAAAPRLRAIAGAGGR
jgi:L-glutamine-phosphate cytidylyltransferase